MIVPLTNFLLTYLFLVPTSPPLNVSGTSERSTSITLSWDEVPKQHRRGEIIGYQLKIVEQDGGNVTQYNTTTNRSLTIPGLKKFTFYNITVSARTSKGISNESQVFQIRTAEDGKPTVIIDLLLQCENVWDTLGKIWIKVPNMGLALAIIGLERDNDHPRPSSCEHTLPHLPRQPPSSSLPETLEGRWNLSNSTREIWTIWSITRLWFYRCK